MADVELNLPSVTVYGNLRVSVPFQDIDPYAVDALDPVPARTIRHLREHAGDRR